jgi:hypothetical protein
MTAVAAAGCHRLCLFRDMAVWRWWADGVLRTSDGCCDKLAGTPLLDFYFLYEFVNLYNHFEIYQNYTTTTVGHGG